MSLLLFSDNKRWAKIGLAFIIIMVSGIYYNIHRSRGYTGLDSSVLLNEVKSYGNGSLCLQQVKIKQEGERFFAITHTMNYSLLNLPETVQKNYAGDYAIRGKIKSENHLIVETIRRKNARFLKLASSMLTALIICLLFFMFFRMTPKGISPKRIS